MKILLTGATGFIGSHIARAFVKEGLDITALVRETSDLRFLPGKIDKIYADIKDAQALKRAFKGFDIVIHNAALSSDWAKREDFYEANVRGTKNVLNALKENGIRNLVLTSTVGVLGEENSTLLKNEASPYKPRLNYVLSCIFESDLNHYRITKTIAEKESILFAHENKINLTVIRPSWVYGPRETSSGPLIFSKTVKSGMRLFPFNPKAQMSVIYVEDLARAYLKAIKKNLTGVNIFIISNPEPVKIKDYLGAFAKETCAEKIYFLPEFIFLIPGIFLEIIYKILRKKNAPILTRSRVKLFCCNNLYGSEKAWLELGFRAGTNLKDGARKTARWWKQNKYL